jgi:hypothetical protein
MQTQITDKTKIDYFVSLIEPLVIKPNNLSLTWLNTQQWAAVPIPDSLNERDAKLIAEAAQQSGYSEGIVVTTELNEKPQVYKISITQEDLLTFNLEFSLSNFVITTEDLGFAIMSEAGYYFIIAGINSFVRKSIGGSLPAARISFREYAEDATWPANTQKFLIEVAKRYELFDGE